MSRALITFACACGISLLLVSCGGNSNSANTVETVTVTRPEASNSQTTSLPRGRSGSVATATTPLATTRTAPAPSFTGGTTSGSSGGLSSALAKLSALGYSPLGTSTYNPNQTLRVLIGARAGSGHQAFFFNGSRYLGTDARTTSAHIRVVGQSDTGVTLSYAVSTGGVRNVRFQLDMGKLVALDTIPSVAARR